LEGPVDPAADSGERRCEAFPEGRRVIIFWRVIVARLGSAVDVFVLIVCADDAVAVTVAANGGAARGGFVSPGGLE